MSSSDEDIDDAGGYDDWDEEGSDQEAAQSLFTSQTFPDSPAAIAFDAAHHSFDLAQFRHEVRITVVHTLRIIRLLGIVRGYCCQFLFRFEYYSGSDKGFGYA